MRFGDADRMAPDVLRWWTTDILIVDDDFELAELLAEALTARRYECRLARDGREGLELIAARIPDLVLLDVEMPILDGPDMACSMLLYDCGAEKIPIVLVSGIVGLAKIAEDVGTPYFLAKPYRLAAALGIVQRALDERIPPHPRM